MKENGDAFWKQKVKIKGIEYRGREREGVLYLGNYFYFMAFTEAEYCIYSYMHLFCLQFRIIIRSFHNLD